MLHNVYLNKLYDLNLSNFDYDVTMSDPFLLRLCSLQLGLGITCDKKVGHVRRLGLTVTNQLLVI